MTAFAGQIFNLVARGVQASTILKGITELSPKLSPAIDKLFAAGLVADMILPKLVSKEEIPPSMFRSDFGDYLGQIKANSAKDYNRLIKALVTTGATGTAVKSIFSKYKIPDRFMQPDFTTQEDIEILPAEPVGQKPTVPRQAAQIEMQSPEPIVTQQQQPLPLQPAGIAPQRQITTPIPSGATIPMAPPEGLTPRQQTISAREQQLVQERQQPTPQLQPIVLEQKAPAPQIIREQAPSAEMQRQDAKRPMLLDTQQYSRNPVFGDTLLKAVKQGFNKKQIKDLIQKAFRRQAAEFEEETGRSIEDELDILYEGKKDILERTLMPKKEKPLVDAGLKPKLKLAKPKPSKSLLEQIIEPTAELPRSVSPNVDKQAFLMQMEELKKLLR